jgi:hypothetical protein
VVGVTDADPEVLDVVEDLTQLGAARLTLAVQMNETILAMKPAEEAGISHTIVTVPLQDMSDAIDVMIRDLIAEHRGWLVDPETNSIVTSVATFRLSPTPADSDEADAGADGREYLIIEPDDSFKALHHGKHITPPSVSIELAPR